MSPLMTGLAWTEPANTRLNPLTSKAYPMTIRSAIELYNAARFRIC